MAIGEIDDREAEKKLKEFDELLEQLAYARQEFHDAYGRYRALDSPVNRTDLLSSIAFYDRFLQSLTLRGTPERRFSSDLENLAVRIDHRWRANEFDQLFRSLDYLHKIFGLGHKLHSDRPDMRVTRELTRQEVARRSMLFYYFSPHEELQVRSISFSSPGSINFEGLATVIAEVRETLHYIFTFQFVRGFIDLYDHMKYDRPINRAEKRMRLKEVIERENSMDRERAIRDAEAKAQFLEQVSRIADLIADLDKKRLASGAAVEEQVVRAMSQLHKLGFDQEKAGLEYVDRDQRESPRL